MFRLIGLLSAHVSIAQNRPSKINVWRHLRGLLGKGNGLIPFPGLSGGTRHQQFFIEALDLGDALLRVGVFFLQLALTFRFTALTSFGRRRSEINDGDVTGGGGAIVYVLSCWRQDQIVEIIVIGIADVIGKVIAHFQADAFLISTVTWGRD